MTVPKGREEGREEGATNRNIEIARKMLAKGLDTQDIIDVTELSLNQLKEIQNK